eukprot:TRINITY_DN8275_c0_g1_i1.p1 TRINITY_DN8275_c0_g1~~TRINITY_DN8275_c0_g1_i1.p1  ORF type:complete len:356 (+),score=83.79 TRINITY_DN8275_c0_g1_i1:38-1069(+)
MAMMEIIPLDSTTKNMVLALMNAEHPDAIRIYAKHYGGKRSVRTAILTDVSDKDLSLHYKADGKDLNVEMERILTDNKALVALPEDEGMKFKTAAFGMAQCLSDVCSHFQMEDERITCETIGDCRRAMVGMARIASEATGEKIVLPEVKSTDLPGGDRRERAGQEPPPEMLEMLKHMRELMAQNAGEASTPSGDSAQSSKPKAGIQTFADSNAESPQPLVFQGAGNRLGGYSTSSSTPGPALDTSTPANAAQQQLREVDPEQPVVRLRVQLLDRRPAEVTVNKDFTVGELQAWIDHHQGLQGQQRYNLMEVSGFPPRRLGDLSATLEQAGLTKRGCSLACRPA